MSLDIAEHYDRVTRAWELVLGPELHYGVFSSEVSGLDAATRALTDLMVDRSRLTAGLDLLDVGCGTGVQACRLAREHGVRVTGITTSAVGRQASIDRAEALGLNDLARFDIRDGADNGFPDHAFDRVWSLESSHLMRQRDRMVSECARVLRPGGRFVLCDIVLRRPLSLGDVRRLRGPLVLLRNTFGDAHMESVARYADLAAQAHLDLVETLDLTEATRPTFDHWRMNAHANRQAVAGLIGEHAWSELVESCRVLERFWDDGTLGYALLVTQKR